MDYSTIEVILNPLAFLEVDLSSGTSIDENITSDHIIKFLCTPDNTTGVQDLVQRYRRINIEKPRLFTAPAEARLLERLIWPLRQAKGSFMVGNFIGTISLCGMVGEMAAILIFDLEKLRSESLPINDEEQKKKINSTVEKKGQKSRVKELKKSGLIDEHMKEFFDIIRSKRRKYLHLWSEDHKTLEADAIACFKAAVPIVVFALGLSMKNGRLILRQGILEYLARHNAGPLHYVAPPVR